MGTGSGVSSSTPINQTFDVQPGNAVGLLEDLLKAISNGSGTNEILQAIQQDLHNNTKSNSPFYERIQPILDDPSIAFNWKQQLIIAIDRAGTPVGIQFMVDFLKGDISPTLEQFALNAIANVGENYWTKQNIEDVNPILQQLWSQSTDPYLLRAVSTGMTRIGETSSLSVLLDSALKYAKSPDEHSDNPHAIAAHSSLQSVQNTALIPLLQERLQHGLDSSESSFCVHLLAGMDQAEAMQAMLAWAQGVDDKYAPLAGEAFARINNAQNLQLINSALARNPRFRSNMVRIAVLTAEKNRQSLGRTLKRVPHPALSIPISESFKIIMDRYTEEQDPIFAPAESAQWQGPRNHKLIDCGSPIVYKNVVLHQIKYQYKYMARERTSTCPLFSLQRH
jgi:hypothetical protein